MERTLLLPLLLAIAGAVVGSFIGLTSLRLPKREQIVLGRSRCSSCAKPLGPVDLVPLLSFLALRGRCRRCGATIEKRYPLIEAASALIGFASGLAYSDSQALAASVLGWWLLLLGLLDFEHYWLPNRLTYPLILLGLAATAWLQPMLLLHNIIGAGAGFALLSGMAAGYRKLRRRHGLGGGDAKLFAAAGAWLGWYTLPFVLLGSAVAALAVALAMPRRGGAFLVQRLPFGAFLAPAIWILYLVRPGSWPG
ncbi:MAG: A24 family peptidase [Pseudomonadota bacterium]|nr:A24 family peptidase [Pseudomonadota bacterium]